MQSPQKQRRPVPVANSYEFLASFYQSWGLLMFNTKFHTNYHLTILKVLNFTKGDPTKHHTESSEKHGNYRIRNSMAFTR